MEYVLQKTYFSLKSALIQCVTCHYLWNLLKFEAETISLKNSKSQLHYCSISFVLANRKILHEQYIEFPSFLVTKLWKGFRRHEKIKKLHINILIDRHKAHLMIKNAVLLRIWQTLTWFEMQKPKSFWNAFHQNPLRHMKQNILIEKYIYLYRGSQTRRPERKCDAGKGL